MSIESKGTSEIEYVRALTERFDGITPAGEGWRDSARRESYERKDYNSTRSGIARLRSPSGTVTPI